MDHISLQELCAIENCRLQVSSAFEKNRPSASCGVRGRSCFSSSNFRKLGLVEPSYGRNTKADDVRRFFGGAVTVTQLMSLVEETFDLDAGGLAGCARRHTHRDGMLLPHIAHIGSAFKNDSVFGDTGLFECLKTFGLEVFEMLLKLFHFEVVHTREKGLHVIATQIGHQHSKCGKMAGGLGDNHRADGKLFSHRCGMKRSAASIRNQSKIARVETAFKCDVTHRVRHRRCGYL